MTPNVIEPLKNLLVEVNTLNFDQANARVHNERNLEAIKQSLTSFGQHNPIVVQKQGMIVRIGNGRLQAAKDLGWTHIAAVIVDESNVDAIARGIADNKTAELATWDFDVLSQLMSGLQEDGVDLSVTGFADFEIEPFMMGEWESGSEENKKPGQDIFENESRDSEPIDPPKEPITKPGDLIILGEHRLLCGDSTKAEDVQRLMDGDNADCVMTDPPYGINQPGVPHDTPEELQKLVGQVVARLPIENGVIASFGWPRTFHFWLNACLRSMHKFERLLWLYKKAQNSNPWRGWIMKSEVIMLSSVNSPIWNEVKPYKHDVYEVSEVSGEIDPSIGWHGSIKPLSVVTDLIKRISKVGCNVYDPFLGSGTTLIASENLERKCFGIEIDPGYCDVIVKRWEQTTGKTAERP